MIYQVREGEPDYFKCACQSCGKRIEFPSNGVGVTVDCPHCGKQTVLGMAGAAPAAKKSRKALWVTIALLVLISGGVVAAFLWPLKPKAASVVDPVVKSAAPVTVPAAPAPAAPAPVADANKPQPPPAAPAAPTIDDFAVGKITLQKMQGSSLVYAVGTAKNTVDRQRFGVKIELNLLDEQDQNIGVVSDYTSVVEPQKDWQFKALLLPSQKGAAKVTVAGIKEQQ